MSRDMTPRRRFQFHPLGCAIALVVIGLLGALLWPPLQSRREASPRTICKSTCDDVAGRLKTSAPARPRSTTPIVESPKRDGP